MLGFEVAQSTVSNYMARPPSAPPSWGRGLVGSERKDEFVVEQMEGFDLRIVDGKRDQDQVEVAAHKLTQQSLAAAAAVEAVEAVGGGATRRLSLR
jgi:hypothetical protein